MRLLFAAVLVLAAGVPRAAAQNPHSPATVEFEPRVGAVGSRVLVITPLPPGAKLRFGNHILPVLAEGAGRVSFLVPQGSSTAFIEVVKDGREVAKSAVPFIVSGTSVVTPRLIGLKEAIDVFGYSDPRPEGGEKPEAAAKPVLKLDDEDILTIGESPPARLSPAVQLGDTASMATQGMGPAGFLFTARPPKKKTPTPTPP